MPRVSLQSSEAAAGGCSRAAAAPATGAASTTAGGPERSWQHGGCQRSEEAAVHAVHIAAVPGAAAVAAAVTVAMCSYGDDVATLVAAESQ